MNPEHHRLPKVPTLVLVCSVWRRLKPFESASQRQRTSGLRSIHRSSLTILLTGELLGDSAVLSTKELDCANQPRVRMVMLYKVWSLHGPCIAPALLTWSFPSWDDHAHAGRASDEYLRCLHCVLEHNAYESFFLLLCLNETKPSIVWET